VLAHPTHPASVPFISDVKAGARSMGLRIEVFNASTESEIDAFAALSARRLGALSSRCYRRIYLSLTILRDQRRSIHHSSRTYHMDQNLQYLIRKRAYEIWSSHGCVHGQADQHWLAAEREILTASTATLPGKPVPQTKRRLPARSKITKALARAS
jgi:hypothetical protein